MNDTEQWLAKTATPGSIWVARPDSAGIVIILGEKHLDGFHYYHPNLNVGWIHRRHLIQAFGRIF